MPILIRFEVGICGNGQRREAWRPIAMAGVKDAGDTEEFFRGDEAGAVFLARAIHQAELVGDAEAGSFEHGRAACRARVGTEVLVSGDAGVCTQSTIQWITDS